MAVAYIIMASFSGTVTPAAVLEIKHNFRKREIKKKYILGLGDGKLNWKTYFIFSSNREWQYHTFLVCVIIAIFAVLIGLLCCRYGRRFLSIHHRYPIVGHHQRVLLVPAHLPSCNIVRSDRSVHYRILNEIDDREAQEMDIGSRSLAQCKYGSERHIHLTKGTTSGPMRNVLDFDSNMFKTHATFIQNAEQWRHQWMALRRK